MKFTTLATMAALFGGAAAKLSAKTKARLQESREKRKLNQEFMAAMHGDQNVKAGRRKKKGSEKLRREKLYEELIKGARKLDQQGQNGNYNNGNYNNGDYNNGNNNNGQYYAEYDEYGVDGQGNLDLTARAFKYAGCAAIKSYDADQGAENGNPLVMDTYAVFRLCPAESCNKYSLTGCGKNYGSYAVDMKTYLQSVLSYYENRYEDYCEYCEACDWEYQLEASQALQECYEDLYQQELQNNQQAQQNAWNQYYQANGGNMQGYNNGGNNDFQNYNNYYNNANNGGNNYNGGNNQNGGNYNYNNYNNNYNQANGGNRKLENYYNYNQNQYNQNNNYNQNAQNQNQNAQQQAQAVNGYYDQNGDWVQNDQQAVENGYGYWGADGIWYAYEDGDYQSYLGMVQCEDGSWCDACQAEVEQEFATCDEYACGAYYTYCTDLYGKRYANYNGENNYRYQDRYDDDEEEGFDVYDYLECTEYENDNGVYYIAPHCSSNHYTISLGVFSDENCLNYIGETVSLAEVLGYGYSDDDLFKMPKECISCDGTEDYAAQQEENKNQVNENQQQYEDNREYYQNYHQQNYEYQQTQQEIMMQQYNTAEDYYNAMDQYEQNQQAYYQQQIEYRQYGNQQGNNNNRQQNGEGNYGLYGAYVAAPEVDDYGVVAMCSALFEVAAQCNVHMNSYERLTYFMTDSEKALEERYCAFIDNIVYGAYDESGEILLSPESFDFSDWRNFDQYRNVKMPVGQALLLAGSIVLVVALLAAAIYMQRSLRRQSTPWRPKQGAVSISRQNSGIVMGRSRSGPGVAPLI